MSYMKKIMILTKENNGFITSLQVTKEKIPRVYLQMLVERGELKKSSRGVYILPERRHDQLFNLQQRFRKGIFSHETALFIHRVNLDEPELYTMTFPAGYNASSIKDELILPLYSVKERYKMGVIKIQTPLGAKVLCYNMERTICDLLQKKAKTDTQKVVDILKFCIRTGRLDISLLSEYSVVFNVEKKLQPYLEILTK